MRLPVCMSACLSVFPSGFSTRLLEVSGCLLLCPGKVCIFMSCVGLGFAFIVCILHLYVCVTNDDDNTPSLSTTPSLLPLSVVRTEEGPRFLHHACQHHYHHPHHYQHHQTSFSNRIIRFNSLFPNSRSRF